MNMKYILGIANLTAQFFEYNFCTEGEIRFDACWNERLDHKIDRFLPISCTRDFDIDACSVLLNFISRNEI